MATEPGDYRVGDTERDEAVAFLREHTAQGRLDAAEFDERVEAVLRARTRRELEAPLADLPPLDGSSSRALAAASGRAGGVTAAPQPASTPARRGGWDWRVGVTSAALPLAVVLCIATDWRYWWIMFLPMVLSSLIWGGSRGDDGAEGPEDHQPESRDEARGPGELPPAP